MSVWSTIVETAAVVAVESPMGQVIGPYGVAAFLTVGVSLAGVTLAVMLRGISEQVRGPAA